MVFLKKIAKYVKRFPKSEFILLIWNASFDGIREESS